MKTPGGLRRSELKGTLWAFRREFLMVAVFSMVANVLMLTPTIYMLQMYDRVMVSRSEITLMAVSLLALFLFAVMAFSDRMRSRVLVAAGLRLDAALGTRVFDASFAASLGQTARNPSSAFNDLIELRQFLTGQGIYALFDVPWSPVYIAVSWLMHPVLGMVSVVFAVLQAALAWFGHRATVVPVEAASRASAESQAYLQSKLRNAEVLEAMGMLPNLQRRWAAHHGNYLRKTSSAQALVHRITAWSKFLRYSQQSLALGAGALLVIDGQLTPGSMIAANILMARALAPIDQLVSTWRSFISARGAFSRLERLLQEYPQQDPALARVAPAGTLALSDVVATAEGRADPILKNIDLQLPAGTVVALLGPSGAGKSTLARVILGIWPEVTGEVLLDGRPVGGWNRIELGPHLGYLPQDVELFDGTIAENIARFDEVDAPKVIRAARSAGLHEMILRLPKGYDSPVGEAGGLLSAGQRQRIGLARALYGVPALVVLDEPNSNLDDAGEVALAKAVQELKAAGRSVLLITHRPSAVAVADRIVLLRDGRIHADGPRDEVLAMLQSPPAAQWTPEPLPRPA